MRSFLLRTGFFVAVILVIILVFFVTLDSIISHGNYFSKADKKHTLVIGHSHAECSFNDSILPGVWNMGSSAESYFYTYLKCKTILEDNPGIKHVLIECSNNQVSSRMDAWTWEDGFMQTKVASYGAFMSPGDLAIIASKNPVGLIEAEGYALRRNLQFVLKGHTDYPEQANWGGFTSLRKASVDSILAAGIPPWNTAELNFSTLSIDRLKRIVTLCHEQKIKIYLVRSPVHDAYPAGNEKEYQQLIEQEFASIPYLDFKQFPLNNDEFADLEHLNYKGARKFSMLFKDLVDAGLLESGKPQEMIDSAFRSLPVR